MGARNPDALSSWIPKADSPLVQFLTIFYLRIISTRDPYIFPTFLSTGNVS